MLCGKTFNLMNIKYKLRLEIKEIGTSWSVETLLTHFCKLIILAFSRLGSFKISPSFIMQKLFHRAFHPRKRWRLSSHTAFLCSPRSLIICMNFALIFRARNQDSWGSSSCCAGDCSWHLTLERLSPYQDVVRWSSSDESQTSLYYSKAFKSLFRPAKGWRMKSNYEYALTDYHDDVGCCLRFV